MVDFLFLTITYSGGYLVIAFLTVLSALSFLFHKHKNRALALFISVGGSAASVWILKHLIDRPRPESALYLETTSSFPSGHAALAMALYGFLFVSIWRHDKHHLRHPSLLLLAFLIVAIGISRLYLGVHFPSDVLAGYGVGIFWLIASLLLARRSARGKSW